MADGIEQWDAVRADYWVDCEWVGERAVWVSVYECGVFGVDCGVGGVVVHGDEPAAVVGGEYFVWDRMFVHFSDWVCECADEEL